MTDEPAIPIPRRCRRGGLRASVVCALAVLSLGLSGCGEPDDDGGGGGGYLAGGLAGQVTAPASD